MRSARITLALFLLLVYVPAFAQQVCKKTDVTIQGCWDRLVNVTAAVAADAATTKNEVAKTNTGVSTIDSPINSALRDFLSTFSASVSSSKLSQNGNTLTLDWNASVAPLTAGNVVKLQAVFTQPVLDPTFKTQLTGKSDFDSISNSLNDLDDVQISATYAPTTIHFGRALAPHLPLLEAVDAAARNKTSLVATLKLAAELRGLQNDPPFRPCRRPAVTTDCLNDGDDPFSVEFSKISDASRSDVEDLLAAAAVEAKDASAIISAQIDPFRRLLSNQPQFYGSAVGHFRKNLVGADTAVLKVTYERGGTSLKDFYATPGGSKCTPAALSEVVGVDGEMPTLGRTCATTFETYVKKESVLVGAAATGRAAFSAEYDWTNSNKINEPQDMISISAPRSHKAVGSFVYGFVATRDAQNREGRFDLNLSYETNSGTGVKNRVIGSAVYSQKLTDTLTLPLGIVYASHPGDLPAADKRVSVHFGLVYKLTNGGK